MKTCQNNATSLTPPVGAEKYSAMSPASYKSSIGGDLEPNDIQRSIPLDPGVHRRPRSSNTFDQPVARSPTEATHTSDRTRDTCELSGTSASCSHSARELWKVKIAGGGYLDSTSYDSEKADENIRSNATDMLKRLKLNNLNDEDEDEDDISTATTKVSNFTFQKKVQKKTLNKALSSAYYRPADNLAKDDGICSSSGGNRVRGADSKAASRDGLVPVRSGLSFTIDTLPSGISSISYGRSDEIETPHGNNTPRRSPHCSSGRTPNYQQSDLRSVSLVKSASESDDDSVKRMKCVTHNFQRNDDINNGRRKSKFSPAQLSGIGVDVRNDYNTDEQYRATTPREAASASCSISSVIGEILGITPPKDGKLSPFNIVRDMMCSPERMRSAGSAQKANRRKPVTVNDDDDDDWSVDNEIQSQYSQGQSYPHAKSENRSPYSSNRRSPHISGVNPHNANQHDRRSVGRTLQEKYDKSLSFRHYHREDLSYYGTEAGSTYYQPSHYSRAEDDRSETVSRSDSFRRHAGYRDSPFVHRLKNNRYDDRYQDDESTSYR